MRPEEQLSYDRRGLDGVCDGNEALRRRILLEFLRTAPLQVEQLLASAAAGDTEEAQRIAHTLKGSSRTVGALTLGYLSERVESGADPVDLRHELERVQGAVQSHLESIA